MADWRGGLAGTHQRIRPERPPPRHEPPVTCAQMGDTLRHVLPRCNPLFGAVLRDIAARCTEGQRELLEPGSDG